MGKRKGRRNNGGTGGVKKTHNHHDNNKNLIGDDHNNNEMQLELASKFGNTSDNYDDDEFFDAEIVEDVLAQAMFHYVLEGGELDQESFERFFLENYTGQLYAKCATKRHWHHGGSNAYYGFDTSSDDDDSGFGFGYRSNNDPPSFSYKQKKRQNGFPKGRKNKNRKGGRSNDQIAIETLIKMLLIQCILEEEGRRNKRFRWKVIGSVFIIAAIFIYYWWF